MGKNSFAENNLWIKKIVVFLTAQSISLFGSSLVQFAIIWYVARTTSSGLMVTLNTFCAFLPQVIISLIGGAWADRYNRKMLIVVSDAIIAISTLILAIFMITRKEYFVALMIVQVIRSAGTGIQAPTVNAIIPQIVPEQHLMRINGINGTIQSSINFISPALGGFLLTYGPIANIMLIDVATAIIGITLTLFITIRTHEKLDSAENNSLFIEVKAGIKYVFEQKFIKKLLLRYMVYTVLIVPAGFLNVLMVTRVFGGDYFYLTLNEMIFFIGSTVGGVFISIWGGFKNRNLTMTFSWIIFSFFTIAMAFVTNFTLYLFCMALVGISIPFGSSSIIVLLQEKVEPSIQGRIFSILQLIFSLCMPLGMAMFGPLADVISIQFLMVICGILMMILSICVLFDRKYYLQGGRK